MKDSQFTPTEQRVLDRLKAGKGRVVTHRALIRAMLRLHPVFNPGDRWIYYEMGNLRQYISRLRKKIEKDPALPDVIITHRGRGYSYEEDFEEFIMRETEAAIEGGIIDDETGLPFE